MMTSKVKIDPTLIPKTAEELDQWVRDRVLDYAAEGIDFSDPINEVEECHHPDPKCLGGTTTVTLLKKDHAIHGVLQSEVYQRPCIYGWESDYLEGELLTLCKKWQSEKGRQVGTHPNGLEAKRKVGRKNVESGHLRSVCSKGGKAGVKSQMENKVGIYGASPEQRYEWIRNASAASDPRAPWWTDGINNKKCRECPGDEWKPGRTMNPNTHKVWWTDGKANKRTDECPGEGWRRGCSQKRK